MKMDPELDAASVLLQKPDISDPLVSRSQSLAVRDPFSSAIVETEGLVHWEDRVIPSRENGRMIPVRVYRPSPSASGACVVYFHGGAFVVGDLGYEHSRCLRYAADAGCTVVSIDYRLAPEHKFPAAVEDCYDGLTWVAENAARLDIDPARIAVAGASAGGGLAAGTCLMARDLGGPAIALQVLIYPVLDDRMLTSSMKTFDATPIWDNTNAALMWQHYLASPESSNTYAAPSRADSLEGLPSAYILAVELDPLRDEAIDYGSRLLVAGIKVELHLVAGAYHGFDHDVPDAAISRKWMNDQSAYVKRFLRP